MNKYIYIFLLFLGVHLGSAQSNQQSQSAPPVHHVCSAFRLFWGNFRDYLKSDNVEELKKIFVLPNPIMADVFSTFNDFAYCDSTKYYRPKGMFDTLQITQYNFSKYYNRLFSKYLKNAIINLTIADIEKDNNQLEEILRLKSTKDSISRSIYINLKLSDSKEYKPCIDKGMNQTIEYMLFLQFVKMGKEYKITRVDAAG